MKFLSGFIALVGPPNVGKSTLLNLILGRKIAIVTPKPQTTRKRILGILHGDGFQMIFVDTPGIHKTKSTLHKSMVSSAQSAFGEVDIMAVMIEMPRPNPAELDMIVAQLKRSKKPSVLIINKIDKGPRQNLLPIINTVKNRHPFKSIHPVSALSGEGMERLLEELKKMLRPGPAFFGPDTTTDQSEPFMISEMIREKIYLRTRQELPYSTAVTVSHIEEDPEKKLLAVSARIHVETESQKAILIGKGGTMIKNIGRDARKEMEIFFGLHVYLDLTVGVSKHWTKNPKVLRKLGY
ncbi:MAG: GTPase Era [Deltaproteobacteria bacterium]|nr:GTPase Era [Deltaproteobacteria bacterium]